MDFILEDITIKNFVTYEEQKIPLNNQGLVLVRGKNFDEPWKGASACGKTNLMDAIAWLLSGTTSRDIKADSVIGQHGKSCVVSGNIILGDNKIKITRYRKDPIEGNSLKLTEGMDVSHRKIKDNQERLDQIIGCSFPLLRLSCFQYGNEENNFSRIKPAHRAKILDEIVGASDSNIPKRYSEINKLIRAEESKIEDIKYEKQSCLREIDTISENIKNNNEIISSSEDDLEKDITEKKKEITYLMKGHDLVSLTKEYNDIFLHKEEKNTEEDLSEKINKINRLQREEENISSSLGNKIYSIEDSNSIINKKIASFSIKTGSICNKCGNKATDLSVKGLKENILSGIRNTDSYEKSLIISKNKIKLLSEKREKIHSLLEEKRSFAHSKNEWKKRIEEVKERNIKADQKKQNLILFKEERKNKIEKLLKTNANLKEKVVSSQSKFTEMVIKNHICVKKIKKLEVLSRFYSPSGFRPLIMQHYAPILSDCSNYFFKDFTNGEGKIIISSKSSSLSEKTVDKIDIQVYEKERTKQFPGAWSKGEGGYIDLSLNAGIMRLASMKASKDFNFMLLDEVTNGLSDSLILQLIKTLKQKFLKPGMTILFTSHHKIPETEFDQVWTCEKRKGKTTINFGD